MLKTKISSQKFHQADYLIWTNDYFLHPKKISPVRDLRSTLRSWRFCQVQSHVTQKLGQISKIWLQQIQILCPSLRISGQLPAPIVNGGDSFWNRSISNFQWLVTLTLVILHTVVHHSSTSTYMPNFIEIEETFCGRTAVRTFETHFIRSTQKSLPRRPTYFFINVSTSNITSCSNWATYGTNDLLMSKTIIRCLLVVKSNWLISKYSTNIKIHIYPNIQALVQMAFILPLSPCMGNNGQGHRNTTGQ